MDGGYKRSLELIQQVVLIGAKNVPYAERFFNI